MVVIAAVEAAGAGATAEAAVLVAVGVADHCSQRGLELDIGSNIAALSLCGPV